MILSFMVVKLMLGYKTGLFPKAFQNFIVGIDATVT